MGQRFGETGCHKRQKNGTYLLKWEAIKFSKTSREGPTACFSAGESECFSCTKRPPSALPPPPFTFPCACLFPLIAPALPTSCASIARSKGISIEATMGGLIPDFPACRPPLEPLSRRPAPAGKRASPSPKAVSHLRGRGQGNATGRAAQDPVKCWQILVGTDPSVGSAPPHARVAGGIMRWQPGQSVPFRKRPGRHR